MLNLSKIFGRSPFGPLRTHMDRVAECVEKLKQIFQLSREGKQEEVEAMAAEISKLEHRADQTKNDIRNNLPKGLFLAINRGQLLDILALQDSIADCIEDIAILLTFRPLGTPEGFEEVFSVFVEENIKAFDLVHQIIDEIDELLETSFSGVEAEKVGIMVDQVARKEHEVDLLQRALMKTLIQMAEELPNWKFFLWLRVIEEVAAISNLSEKLGNQVRMTLELK